MRRFLAISFKVFATIIRATQQVSFVVRKMYTQNKIISSLFVVFIICVGINATIENMDSHNKNSYMESTSNGWMGRRLKRNPKDEINPANLYKEDLNTLAEIIQENPWTIVTNIPEGQKRQMNFTPRLGRDTTDDNIERWMQDTEMIMNSGDVKSTRGLQYFSPRLGRFVRNHPRFFGHYA